MSDPVRIGVVAEGPTDFIVILALAQEILGDREFVPVQIQPPESDFANSQGPLGGGWPGVFSWCQIQGSGGADACIDILANLNVLVIHVDADIARERDLAHLSLTRPCPPASDTVDRVRDHLLDKLGLREPPPRLVFCIPAQATEAWVFACLHPDEVDFHQPFECRPKPESLLVAKGPYRLARKKGSKVDKDVGRYRDAAGDISAGWDQACGRLAEAERFRREFLQACP